MSIDRFHELLSRFLDDELRVAELDELLLLAESREEYVKEMRWQLALADRLSQYEDESRDEKVFYQALETRIEAESTGERFIDRVLEEAIRTEVVPVPRVPANPIARGKRERVGGAAAQDHRKLVGFGLAGLLLASIACVLAIALRQGNPPLPVATPAVAHLTDLADAQWPAGRMPLSVGTELRPGPLRLLGGTVRLTFTNGAVVTLTGPADLELITPLRVFLRHGTLVSYVPPRACGFTVLSPHGQLVDRDTDFAVQVNPASRTDVQVLTGKVEVAPNTVVRGGSRSLTAGYAARLEATAGAVHARITQRPLLLDHFEVPDTSDLNSRLSERQQGGMTPVRYVSLDADAPAAIRQGRLAIPFEGRKGRKDTVSRVVLEHDFNELVGRRFTIAFKAHLPEMGSIPTELWLAFVLEDGGQGRAEPLASLAYQPTAEFSVILSLTHWQVGVRTAGRHLTAKRVFAPSQAAGPYQVLLCVDDTTSDGPLLDLEVNGIPVVTGQRVPMGAGRRFGFHTWTQEHSDGRGWAAIDDFCVSVESESSKTRTTQSTEAR